MISRRKILQSSVLFAIPVVKTASAQSEIKKILVGFAPGTATDGLSRALAERLKTFYGPNFIVENRAGVSGQLAVVALKSAPPDGSTMLVTPMSALTVYPHTFAKLGYEASDLQPIGTCAIADFAFAVGPGVPETVKTIAQFLEWCKANSEKANFATGATGSKLHFAGVKLGMESGVKLTHIGYTNSGTAMTDLAGGNVPAYVGVIPTVLPFLNRVRVLATMGTTRSRFLPDVPTLVEAGFPQMVIFESFGLYVPMRTPADQTVRLHDALVNALNASETKATLTTLGMEAKPSTAAELETLRKTESDQWGKFVRQIEFKQDT